MNWTSAAWVPFSQHPRGANETGALNLRPALLLVAATVPLAVSYAHVAGMPAQYALFAAPAALVGYARYGSPRHAVAPNLPTAAVSAAVVASVSTGHARAAALSAGLAIVVSVVLIAAGIARLGFVRNLLTGPAIEGFLTGVAALVALHQMPILVGQTPPTDLSVASAVAAVFDQPGQWSWPTVLVSSATISVLVIARRAQTRVLGPLIALSVAIAASVALGLPASGVTMIGDATGRAGTDLPPLEWSALGSMLAGAPPWRSSSSRPARPTLNLWQNDTTTTGNRPANSSASGSPTSSQGCVAASPLPAPASRPSPTKPPTSARSGRCCSPSVCLSPSP